MKKGKQIGTLAGYVLTAGIIVMSGAMAVSGGEKKETDEHRHEHKHEHAAPAAKKGGANPLVEEMLILDGVYREVVSAVSVGDGKRVYHALHSMHGTMEKTHEGVHHGTVKLTKNADKLETFVKMDKDFHGELENLAAVAKKNDQQAMLTITKGLLDGCVKCHQMYR